MFSQFPQNSLLTGIVIATKVPVEVVMVMIIIKHHYDNRNLWKVKEKNFRLSIGIKEFAKGRKAETAMNMRLEQWPEQREMITQKLNKQERKETISKTEGRDVACIRKRKAGRNT